MCANWQSQGKAKVISKKTSPRADGILVMSACGSSEIFPSLYINSYYFIFMDENGFQNPRMLFLVV